MCKQCKVYKRDLKRHRDFVFMLTHLVRIGRAFPAILILDRLERALIKLRNRTHYGVDNT